MIRLTIAAESATVSRDPRGVCVHLHLDVQDIVRAVTDGLEDAPELGKLIPASALRRQIAESLALSLEPADAVKLIHEMSSFAHPDGLDAAVLDAVSRLAAKVCVLAHDNPDDADLLAVVAHMRKASGMALCHLAPSPIMRDERVISGGAA